MSLYPSLEDMKVDQMIVQQQNAFAQVQSQTQSNTSNTYPAFTKNSYSELSANKQPMTSNSTHIEVFPDLYDFMGMELSKAVIAANMPEYLNRDKSIIETSNARNIGMVAPLSGNSVGLQRAQVTHGIRELILCKGSDKKVGLRVQSIDKGIFVCMVVKSSPAAMAGLRFGDQILQICGKLVAGMSVDDVHKIFKKGDVNNISVVVRDRPFERTITLHKDSRNDIGFLFKDGKISHLVKDSTSARNGVLVDHFLLEVDGQNVVGMKDKEIKSIIENAPQIITITVIPEFIYNHMMKKLSTPWVRGLMDHSIPDL